MNLFCDANERHNKLAANDIECNINYKRNTNMKRILYENI